MTSKNEEASTEKTGLRILRLPQVRDRVSFSTSGIYALISANKFPKPIKLSAQSVGWIESEIDEWLRERVAASRGVERQS
jgi:prophage regulatory protein